MMLIISKIKIAGILKVFFFFIHPNKKLCTVESQCILPLTHTVKLVTFDSALGLCLGLNSFNWFQKGKHDT